MRYSIVSEINDNEKQRHRIYDNSREQFVTKAMYSFGSYSWSDISFPKLRQAQNWVNKKVLEEAHNKRENAWRQLT